MLNANAAGRGRGAQHFAGTPQILFCTLAGTSRLYYRNLINMRVLGLTRVSEQGQSGAGLGLSLCGIAKGTEDRSVGFEAAGQRLFPKTILQCDRDREEHLWGSEYARIQQVHSSSNGCRDFRHLRTRSGQGCRGPGGTLRMLTSSAVRVTCV